MATSDTYIEVPVTCQSSDVYYFRVTPEMLEENGVNSAKELVVLIQNEVIDPFEFDGEWDSTDSEVQQIHYDWSRVC